MDAKPGPITRLTTYMQGNGVHILTEALINFILPFVIWVLSRTGAGGPAKSMAAPSATGLSLAEAFRTRRFWLLLAVYSLCGFEDFFVSTHIVAFAQDRGADILLAGNLLALMGLTALIGVLISGALSDRIGPVAATLASFALRAGLFMAVLADQRIGTVAAFTLLFGFSFLMTAPLTVIFVRDAFGARHLGAITGFITMIHHICGGLGALVGAALFDVQGSYTTTLWLMLVSSILGGALTLGLRPRKARSITPAPTASGDR